MAVRSAGEKSAINRMLGNHGLPPLESGAGLFVALAFLVEDHEHFRSLLIRCEPEERGHMYNAMAPNLRFKAKPLDVYVAESARLAEQHNLPTIDAEGREHWSIPAPSQADIAAAQHSVNQLFAKKRLVVTCLKCTKEEMFTGDSMTDAVMNARLAGWALWQHEVRPNVFEKREICPDCPAIRKAD